mmetsp:Transcript_28653/g.91396  ORF Transcript_28653/g.91396 Transcript_28653/m.91396 type:complete len:211 (-) Transcript_28653:413-1045(-)
MRGEILVCGDEAPPRSPPPEKGGGAGGGGAGEGGADSLSYDECLEMAGTGPFQTMILLICGLGNAADAVEIMSIGLVLPSAEGDLGLTARDKGTLSSCIFVGMLLGGVLLGLLGDLLGRKRSLAWALALNAVFGGLSAAARHVPTLLLLRTLAGVGVGGSVPLVFSTLGEFIQTKDRGVYMVLLASFWMVGSVYVACVGWAVIPTAVRRR